MSHAKTGITYGWYEAVGIFISSHQKHKTIISPWLSLSLFLGTVRSVSPHCSDCALFLHMLDVSLLCVSATLHYPSPAAALSLPSPSRLKLSAGKPTRYLQLPTWPGARSLLYLNRGLRGSRLALRRAVSGCVASGKPSRHNTSSSWLDETFSLRQNFSNIWATSACLVLCLFGRRTNWS